MGHMFSQHTPSFFHNDHQFPVAKLDENLLATYQGLEEDGDQKIFVENLCRETAVCQETVKAYESCVERVEGKDGAHCKYQYLNMWGCVDYCAAAPHFKLLQHGVRHQTVSA
eukprot:Rhum_TRINITY_DN14869_c5_g1::Rhum_TRINITY_DN14869_c5_g1_i1::g.123732::m.123732/K00416/QCR6, UQCRH; ubiquinol-cytochrome c reductase subunit 6